MIEPKPKRSEFVTIRTTPAERRRLDAAADVAGVSLSRVLREGGLGMARKILREAAQDDDE